MRFFFKPQILRDADTIKTPFLCRIVICICKFATLCHQPSQLFVIREINFSDPLLSFLLKGAFILLLCFEYTTYRNYKEKSGDNISLQICDSWPLVVTKRAQKSLYKGVPPPPPPGLGLWRLSYKVSFPSF